MQRRRHPECRRLVDYVSTAQKDFEIKFHTSKICQAILGHETQLRVCNRGKSEVTPVSWRSCREEEEVGSGHQREWKAHFNFSWRYLRKRFGKAVLRKLLSKDDCSSSGVVLMWRGNVLDGLKLPFIIWLPLPASGCQARYALLLFRDSPPLLRLTFSLLMIIGSEICTTLMLSYSN